MPYSLRGPGDWYTLNAWEIVADESGSLIFTRHREGHESYQCPPAEISPSGHLCGVLSRLGLPDSIQVNHWAVI